MDVKAAYIHWACTAPHNNKHVYGKQKFIGVGGHLFAVAADRSFAWGYDGVVHGFALNKELLNHYIETLGATYLGAMHPYQFAFKRVASQILLEVYTYEWN